MKKYFVFLITLLVLSTTAVQAQSDQCTTIDSTFEYNTCCDVYTPENSTACAAFNGTVVRRTEDEWATYCKNLTAITTKVDYDECCEHLWGLGLAICANWDQGGNTIPGQVNGGNQPTNTIFGAQPQINGNPAVSPQSSSAALASCSAIKFKSLLDILIWIKCVITAVIIPLIFTLATLFFLWNVLTFIRSSDKTNKEEAKQRMGWGIIALFVMLGVWGIITILSNTLGLSPTVPLLQTDYLDPANANK